MYPSLQYVFVVYDMLHILLSCDSQGSMECICVCIYVCEKYTAWRWTTRPSKHV